LRSRPSSSTRRSRRRARETTTDHLESRIGSTDVGIDRAVLDTQQRLLSHVTILRRQRRGSRTDGSVFPLKRSERLSSPRHVKAGMTFQTIIVDVSPDGVATVTLNRPEVLNAFNNAMCAEFKQLWSQVRSDDAIRAVVLAAAGERAFCTGVDVSERLDSDSPFLDRAQPWAEHEDPGRDLSPRRNEVWKPVIAAVHGMCAGGAFYWIADCDIVVCSPEATFFDPHVTYGFVAALEPIALRYRMPFSDVMRMALLGLHERMTAERALAAGLVTEIVERDALLGRAGELAKVIAGQPPAAVQGTVKALWQSLDMARGQALATALMYTQIGNPIGTEQVDRDAVKPAKPWRR